MEATYSSWRRFRPRPRKQAPEATCAKSAISWPSTEVPRANLYRYFRSSNRTFPNLIAATLFTDIATDAAGEELLARNVVGMKITPVGANGGHWASFDPSSNSGLPAMIEITLSTIGQDTANRLEEADWTATNSGLMTRAVQTLTTRISFPQQQ